MLQLAIPVASLAQFVSNGLTYYSKPNGKGVLIVVPGIQNTSGKRGVAGIFLLSLPSSLPQTFNPENVKLENSKSAFLQFNFSTNSFTKVHLGPNVYEIAGGFTLEVGVLRISINPTNSSYCFVVSQEKGQPPAMLGFLGVSPVFSFTGYEALKLLDPNSWQKQFGRLISNYVVDNKQFLTVNGTRLTVTRIGVDASIDENICLSSSARILDPKSSKLVKFRKKGKKLALANPKKLKWDQDILSRLLTFRVTSKFVVGLDMESGAIARITPVENSGPQTICKTNLVEIHP